MIMGETFVGRWLGGMGLNYGRELLWTVLYFAHAVLRVRNII